MVHTPQLNIVQGNTAPDIEITIQRNGNTVSLAAGDTVDLILSTDSTIVNAGHQSCVVTDRSNGVVTYTPQSGDFTQTGDYLGDVRITYAGGRIEICRDQLSVSVRAKLS